MDRETGRSKGFGFVEMGRDAEAQKAIEALNGKSVDGRSLTVNEARPKELAREKRYLHPTFIQQSLTSTQLVPMITTVFFLLFDNSAG
jgi:RNA recognition motif-containing protein